MSKYGAEQTGRWCEDSEGQLVCVSCHLSLQLPRPEFVFRLLLTDWVCGRRVCLCAEMSCCCQTRPLWDDGPLALPFSFMVALAYCRGAWAIPAQADVVVVVVCVYMLFVCSDMVVNKGVLL